MNLNKSHLKFVLLALSFLLASCSIVQSFQPTPTATPPPVSEQQAIEAATRFCDMGHTQQIQPPTNIKTRIVTLKEASDLLGSDYVSGDSPNRVVWLVTIEGKWQLVGGPRPTNTPIGQVVWTTTSPTFFDFCSAIVDANTGQAFALAQGANLTKTPTK